MSDTNRPSPTGFIATCRCGVVVGALDYLRTDRGESSRILGQWLHRGCTVEPRFVSEWNARIESCLCHVDTPTTKPQP